MKTESIIWEIASERRSAVDMSQTHVFETHVCPVHGQSSIEQAQQVLSKLSDEDLRILTDTEPHLLAAALSTVAGTRCLVMLRDLKANSLFVV
ncbi:MAG: hypothetical protein HYT67_01530 [Candidatus Yanofskybacteria bacterium]|nr:hypothetical protein [Candidatus Yanofskybacteria bacterium]